MHILALPLIESFVLGPVPPSSVGSPSDCVLNSMRARAILNLNLEETGLADSEDYFQHSKIIVSIHLKLI